ncbi:MAG: methionine gamma-lyase family protein [Lachnospiraceae bacterium]|nr:methionine gamma-lyase family protein [Lachnospiraceae bacterium]
MTTTVSQLYQEMGIDADTLAFGESVLEGLKDRFEAIDAMAEQNGLKVLHAMQEARLSEAHLNGTTGYGYNDTGREAIEEIYARAFHTEDALVRPLIACGTHALAIAMSGNLRPGDELLAVSGRPYDTLEEVIGIRPSKGSLAEYGVTYAEVELLPDSSFDYDGIKKAINDRTRLIHIQRSRGYSSRKSLSVDAIGDVIAFIRTIKPEVIIMVDNCYGEFVEEKEPSDVGADMIVGSLIKNPGGGLAPIGGYICGTKACVENAAYRLTTPGLGKEVGATLGTNRLLLQGFFQAPTVTASALKAALFASALYEKLGFEVFPASNEKRTDIIQAVTLRSAEGINAFCRGIQKGAPVDAYVTPEPWDMPGYDDPVVMAAGAFVSGSSIELSADAPIRAPYNVYFQGGLTWPSAKLGILMSLQCLKEDNLVSLS